MIQVWGCDDSPSFHIFSWRIRAKRVKVDQIWEGMTKEWGKTAKCANYGFSENLSERGVKKSEASEIITSTIVQHCARDRALKFASYAWCRLSCTQWSLFWLFFWRVLVYSDAFKAGNSTLSRGLQNLALWARFYNIKGWFWEHWKLLEANPLR